jgi:hypothetical protein
MDSFPLIQQFFTQMSCQHCQESFDADSIELIREDEGVYLVGVHCHHCNVQVGVAMVGVQRSNREDGAAGSSKGKRKRRRYRDPELTESELERLNQFDTVTDDDVIEAHRFIQGLDEGWMKFIPQEMLERCTASDTEAPQKQTVAPPLPDDPPTP